MNKFFLFIKRIFRFFGIEIRFIRKNSSQSAFELNREDIVNRAWSDEKISQKFLSREVLKRFEELLSILRENRVDLTNKSVIDVGCGNGLFLKILSENYILGNQTGMEYVNAAIEVAGKINPGPEYVLHNIENSFPRKFDAVFCTEVLEHIPNPGKAMKNMLEMLNNNGVLILTVPNGRLDQYEGHINFWSPESWRVFIEDNAGNKDFITGSSGYHLLYAIISFRR
jgi:2-polyprenyl-3-methyl-5-hydroxy-6-metoxy-1,4-benzoquinol methylase